MLSWRTSLNQNQSLLPLQPPPLLYIKSVLVVVVANMDPPVADHLAERLHRATAR